MITKQVREERIPISQKNDATLIFKTNEGNKVKARIINISEYGCRIMIDDHDLVLYPNMEIHNAKLSINDNTFYNGSVMITNELTDDGQTTYGLCFKDNSIDIKKAKSLLSFADENHIENIQNGLRLIDSFDKINPEFKALTADLNTLFSTIKTVLEKEEQNINNDSKDNTEISNKITNLISVAVKVYGELIHNIFLKFQSIVQNFSFEEHSLYKRYFRANFNSYTAGAGFIQRGYEKPLGYAGDFGLMLMLYEYEDIGNSIFEKFFHNFSCHEPAAVANKNRVILLSDILESYIKEKSNKNIKVTSLACGPAREIQLFLDKIRKTNFDTVEAILIDNEELALQAAKKRLRNLPDIGNRLKTKFLREDVVLGLIKRKNFVHEIDGSDFIISAGLFDYLNDKTFTKMVEPMYSLLAPGGTLIIGNVSVENPEIFSMSYLMDWYLILRSKEDLVRLVPENIKNTPGVKINVISEELKLNLFLCITKPL